MASAVSESSIKLGKVFVDKETGRTKVSQVVDGVDVGAYLEEIQKAKMVPVTKQADTIKLNDEKLAALNDFKAKVLLLNKAAGCLTNSLTFQNLDTPNLMAQKMATCLSSGVTPPGSIVRVDPYDYATVGSFNLTVNQTATADSCSTQISAPSTSTALGLNGTFTVGTTTQGTATNITITPTMTLDNITSAINAVSGVSTVSATYSLVSSGSSPTYQLSLTTSQLGTPLVLQDIMPALPTTPATVPILQGWNFLPSQPVSVTSGSIALTINTNLGLSGTLNLSAGTGVATPIDLTGGGSGMTLQQLATAVNASTLTSNVSASIIPIYGANALSATAPTGYALQLSATAVGQPLNFLQTNATVLNSLQLQTAVASSINSVVTSADPAASQSLTGNLSLQAGPSGAAFTPFDITGLSLNQIVNQINLQTTTTNVFAKLQVISTTVDPTTKATTNVCQLTLATNNGESVIINGSDPSVLTGLGLTNPIKDYQGLLAKINVNGVNYQRSDNCIKDVVQGVTLNLQSANSTPVAVSITQKVTSITEGMDTFIGVYNDLNSFYNKQTAMKPDDSEPEEGAALVGNQYAREFMDKLQKRISAIVTGPANGSLLSLNAIGFRLNIFNTNPDGSVVKGDGSLRLDTNGGMKSLDTVLNSQLNELIALCGNTVTNTNAKFSISGAPNLIDPTFAGQNMVISIANNSNTPTGTLTVSGVTYQATVSVVGGFPTLSFKNTGTCLDDFKFLYNQVLANNATDTTTINIVPGVMAQVNGYLNTVTDPDKDLNPPFEVKGSLFQEIESIQNKNKKAGEDMKRMEKNIKRELASIEASFSAVYKAKEKYNSIKMMLESFNKVK